MGQSRTENILENMLGASNPLGEPKSREEALLMQILDKIGLIDKAIIWRGVTTTEITDGSSTNPIMINGESYTAKKGDLVAYISTEFVFNGTVWQEFGADFIDDTEAQANKTYSSNKIEGLINNTLDDINTAYVQKLTQTLKVSQNILTDESVVLGANWSGTIAGGLSHSSGSTEQLEFNLPTTSGKPYLVTFDATGVNAVTGLNVKIGDLPLVDIYNGRTDFVVGFISDGGNLVFTPKSNYSGTITNLKLREVTDDGDEVTFTVKNVNTKENNSGLSGFWNVALGFDSFDNNENGSRNVALGFQSLHYFKSGTRNLALGTYAMNRLENGDRNIAVGADSMWYAKKATDCIALGHNSMSGVGTEIEHNVAIGQDSLGGLTTGKNNIAIGFGAMVSPQTNSVSNSTCIGANAGNYGHSNSTFIGSRAGYFMKGISNTCVGYGSGAQQNASGARNVFLGATCGIDNTGATAQNPKNVDDSIVIGYGAKTTKSNQMMLGSTDITEVVMCGNKKINFNQDGTVTWETLV